MPDTRFRRLELDTRRADAKARTVPVVLSTETPVDRGGWVEVLSHTPEAVDLSRAPLPLVESHDTNTLNIGIVEGLFLDGDRLRGLARFGKSQRAAEVFADVLDGIVPGVSIGYLIHDHQDEGERVTVTRWTPYEASAVAVPADTAAGFNRSAPMAEANTSTTGSTPAASVTITDNGADERKRCQDIHGLARMLEQRGHDRDQVRALADEAVERGLSVSRFSRKALEQLDDHTPVGTGGGLSSLGLSTREANRFSFIKAMRALADPQKAHRFAGFELEVSQAEFDRRSKAGENIRENAISVPVDVLSGGRRDLAYGVASADTGSNVVAQDFLSGSFIERLRNRDVLLRAGATVLDDLVGNVVIPRQTAEGTAYWVSEAGAITESNQTFDQVSLTPHTMGAMTDITRRMLLQSTPSAEMLVQNDLIKVIALERQRVAINGAPDASATPNEPRGILNTSGIGSYSNGAAGGAPGRDTLVKLEEEVAVDNADEGTLGFMTNAKVRSKMRRTLVDSGSGLFVWGEQNTLLGHPAWVTNAVPSNLTESSTSSLSALIYGDWSSLLVGQWGGIDLTLDPYTNSNRGTLRLVVFCDMDVAVRHPESFAASTDIITT